MSSSNVITRDFWSETKPPVLNFDDINELRKFVERGQVSIKTVLEVHIHNAQSLASDFYRFYKEKNSNTVKECYPKFEYQVDENSNNCVGRMLKIRKSLLEDLDAEFPDLKNCLFVASSTLDEKYATKLPTISELEKDKYHMTEIVPHCVLLARIIFNGRSGVVLFETINLHFKPIVIMDDNGFPSDSIVPLRKDKLFRFVSIEGKYIRFGVESSKSVIIRLLIYVEKPYLRWDFSAKLLCLSDKFHLNYVLIKDGKTPVHIFINKQKCFVFYMETEGLVEAKVEIPFKYILGNEINPEFEDVLMKSQILLQEVDLKRHLKYFAKSTEDDKFNEEVKEYYKFITNSG